MQEVRVTYPQAALVFDPLHKQVLREIVPGAGESVMVPVAAGEVLKIVQSASHDDGTRQMIMRIWGRG